MRNVCTKIRRKAEGSKRTDTKNAPHGASSAGTVRGTRERRKNWTGGEPSRFSPVCGGQAGRFRRSGEEAEEFGIDAVGDLAEGLGI